MNNMLVEILKKMKGSLICIGADEAEFLDVIDNNDNISFCYILSNNGNNSKKKFKMFESGRSKTVNIKKLKKYFRIKSVDNILCNYDTIKKHCRSFQGGSVFINRGKLYIYGKLDDLNNLKERYERYTSDVKLTKKNKHFLLTVNNKNTKSTILKDGIYMLQDLFHDGIDFLTDFLAN